LFNVLNPNISFVKFAKKSCKLIEKLRILLRIPLLNYNIVDFKGI